LLGSASDRITGSVCEYEVVNSGVLSVRLLLWSWRKVNWMRNWWT